MSGEERESQTAMIAEPAAGTRGPRWRALLEARWQARLREVTELSLAIHTAIAADRTDDGASLLATGPARPHRRGPPEAGGRRGSPQPPGRGPLRLLRAVPDPRSRPGCSPPRPRPGTARAVTRSRSARGRWRDACHDDARRLGRDVRGLAASCGQLARYPARKAKPATAVPARRRRSRRGSPGRSPRRPPRESARQRPDAWVEGIAVARGDPHRAAAERGVGAGAFMPGPSFRPGGATPGRRRAAGRRGGLAASPRPPR